MGMPMRVAFGGLALAAAATGVTVLVAGGVGLLAWAAYLALRAGYGASGAAAWVGAGMLALAGIGLAWVRMLGRRGGRAAPAAAAAAAAPGSRRTGVPAALAWLEREPMAAAVLAAGLGFGAARSRRVRRVVEDILRDWPGAEER